MTDVRRDLVQVTVNGVPVEGFTNAEFIRVGGEHDHDQAKCALGNVTFTVTMEMADPLPLVGALFASLHRPRSRYWARRLSWARARSWRQLARKVGVSYRVFRRWCRTWPPPDRAWRFKRLAGLEGAP